MKKELSLKDLPWFIWVCYAIAIVAWFWYCFAGRMAIFLTAIMIILAANLGLALMRKRLS
jgi:hypothetical protein